MWLPTVLGPFAKAHRGLENKLIALRAGPGTAVITIASTRSAAHGARLAQKQRLQPAYRQHGC